MDPLFRILLLLLLAAGGAAGDAAADALLEFKKGIDDDPEAPLLSSWSTYSGGGSPCSWRGVACDAAGNAVALDLSGFGLSGDVKLGVLASATALQNISLAGNSFTGRIPPVIGTLADLRYVNLAGNRFYGPVPDRIANLSGLAHLNLSGNNFSQTFPVSVVSALENLRVLDLRGNALNGNATDLLAAIRYAEHIDLSNNGFYGSLDAGPSSLTTIGNTVRYLNFSGNMLSGNFFSPESVIVFKSLEVLDLAGNQITGQMPPLNTWYNLKVLRLSANLMSGMIPQGLLQSPMQLVELDLSGNEFSGPMPIISSSTLKSLNLSSNALSGFLPSTIGICTSIDLSKNIISGDLSLMNNWGNTVESIDLSSNELSGSLPSGASRFQNLISMKLGNNSLSGALPTFLGSYQKLSVLDLSMNEFEGPLLPELLTSTTLTILNLSRNKLNGTIPLGGSYSTESVVLYSSSLESLDLSGNSFSGSLSPAIGQLQKLKLIDLGRNNLSGDIPSELSGLDSLEYLNLCMNNLSGSIPDLSQSGLAFFNVSYNNLSGIVPKSLERFPYSSFHPGNDLLIFPDGIPTGNENGADSASSAAGRGPLKVGARIALIVGCIGFVMLLVIIVIALFVVRPQRLCGKHGFAPSSARETKLGRFVNGSMFKSSDTLPVTSKASFSNDDLLTQTTRSLSLQKELLGEPRGYGHTDVTGTSVSTFPEELDSAAPDAGLKGSPILGPHHRFPEEPVAFEVYSPDRLVGDLIFLDNSLSFTAEDLSRAPAEVLGRSSHGTTYKATLQSGRVLTVKWLRVGLVRHKKEFAKEAKRIGLIKHPNVVSWRALYWGPREQERLIISDYVDGDSLALYLYESTPRRYSRLSVSQRLKVAIDVAQCLFYLHQEKGLPHGNLKPTNVFLTGPNLTARLADYGLHRLMTPSGTAEQILNLGALGYRAPELAIAPKALPSFKADVYAFGVIVMEMLTRKSAGDIISGQPGAVDLTDWVQMCNREGRGNDCFDRDITGLQEAPRVMDELLALSLRCILPVNDRPNMKTVVEELSAITM